MRNNMIEFNEPEAEAKENIQLEPDPMIELGNEIKGTQFLLIHYINSIVFSLDRCPMHHEEDLNIATRVSNIIENYVTIH
jgi:hypothetical protein